jgi:hypothetical protein
MSGQDARLYAASYAPSVEQLTQGLADLGDGMAGQFAELERAESIAYNLDGARRHVLKLRERLIAEGEGNGQ